MKLRIFGVLAVTSAALGASLYSSTAVAAPGYDPAMVAALASEFGTTPDAAVERLDREQNLSATLERVKAQGASVDGAFFDSSGKLVVNTTSVDAVRAAGLTPRVARHGERGLNRLTATVERVVGADLGQVRSWGADVAADRVVVTMAANARQDVVSRLTALDGVVVERAAEVTTYADVVPGRIMDLVPGTNCSLGFNGTRNGQKVVLTAGHCVVGNPDILDANGTHIGRGIATRFPSYDMGLMSVDAEDTQRAYVDTRMNTTVAVRGMSKAPIGSAICKAGNTTGWTCGTITAYNQTANYGTGTLTRGLARSTVCSEGGDSGGAYISGTSAQGMTSGGPRFGPDCGYNRGTNAPQNSFSFYQPVVDAAQHYGVSLLTS